MLGRSQARVQAVERNRAADDQHAAADFSGG
jgi:hypothetical protein